MAIIGVFPDWRTSSYDIDEKGQKTAIVVVQVQTDDDKTGLVTGWKEIVRDSRFPQRGTFFGFGGYAIGVNDTDSELSLWRIHAESETATYAIKKLTLTYKSMALNPNNTDTNKDKGKGGNNTDPTAEAPDIEEDYQPYGKVLAKDVAGNLLVNSAGDPFEPITVTLLQRVIRIKFNLSVDDHTAASNALKDTTNSQPMDVGGIPIAAGAGRIGGLKSSRKRKNGVTYYETTITILDRSGDPDAGEEGGAWGFRLLDVGCNYINPLAPTGKSSILDNGNVMKLHALSGGQPSILPDVLTFTLYNSVNWNNFDFLAAPLAQGN
jgi:hypothetical protein